MTTKTCEYKKHTPIVSEKQKGLFGSELARRKKGKKRKMKGITTKELRSHLKESAGKDLPKMAARAEKKANKIRRGRK